MGVLWWEIKYLKSAVTTFLKQKSIVPISGIWNEIQWNLDLMTIDLVTNRDLVDSFVSGHLFEVSYGWNPFKHFVITIPKCSFLSWDIPIGHLKVFLSLWSLWKSNGCLDYVICWRSTQSYWSWPRQLFLFILHFCIWVQYELRKLFPLGQYKRLILIK